MEIQRHRDKHYGELGHITVTSALTFKIMGHLKIISVIFSVSSYLRGLTTVFRFIGSVLLVLACSDSVGSAASPPKMRPYSGIGIVVLQGPDSGPDRGKPLHLYEEPGIFRRGELSDTSTSGNEWVFGMHRDSIRLIVVARKGSWLRVCYDDAGREAWIDTRHRGTFQPWDQYLKGQVSHLLPRLRKQYYQLYQQPDLNPLSVLTPKQPFKVLKLENDWVMVMSDQNTIGWLRWRDEDGRLLVGVGSDIKLSILRRDNHEN